jgi:2'-5' RNA ligase
VTAKTEILSADQANRDAAVNLTARVFVALKIASDIAQELVRIARPLEQFSIRSIAPADIHLTLVPPWNEPTIQDAIERLRCVARAHSSFNLELRQVRYGPQPNHPRVLWVECESNDRLNMLHAALLRAFGQIENRSFLPHITLARLRDRGARIARKCPIDRDIALTGC